MTATLSHAYDGRRQKKAWNAPFSPLAAVLQLSITAMNW